MDVCHCTPQANVYCRPSLATKAVVVLTLFALAAKGFRHLVEYLADVRVVVDVYIVLFNVVVPLAVLAINAIVVREVRRASNRAAAENLGRQQPVRGRHQQQQQQHRASSNSAVPTVMLLTTSIIYALLCAISSCLYITWRWLPHAVPNHGTGLDLRQVYCVAVALRDLIYANNFLVYFITGKQFRSELRRLVCFGRSAAAGAGGNEVNGSVRPRLSRLRRTV